MPFERIYIKADNVNAAAGEILGVLEDPSKANVMYFEGWNGLGASAALRVVAQRLESRSAGSGLKFDKVIHVDCSVWKSRRALQKAVAEELQLPRRVMAIFDQRDEEDDFQGVDEGSRGEIPDVTWEIFTNLSGHRFVVVFHNGSGSYIDLIDFGVPVHGYLLNRVLWTEQGRFKPSRMLSFDKFKKFIGNTGVCLSAMPKISTFGEFMRSKTFEFMRSKKFEEIRAQKFEEFVRSKTIEEFMRSKTFEEFVAQKFEEFMRSKTTEEFMRFKTIEEFMRSKTFEEFGAQKFEEFMRSKTFEEFGAQKFEEFMRSKTTEEFMRSKTIEEFMRSKTFQKFGAQKYEEFMGSKTIEEFTSAAELWGLEHEEAAALWGLAHEEAAALWGLAHEEAEELAKYYTGAAVGNIINHRLVEECVLYMWALRRLKIIDWGTHASNYWVCDGIIQCSDTHTSAWEIGDALQRYIRLDWSWMYMDRAVPFSATHLQHDHEPPRQAPICFISSSSSKITSVPPGVTSFFLVAAAKEPSTHTTILPAGMFQHSGSRLRVLHLSRCTFSFASPPFICCSDLRFLLLDHCKDDKGHSYSGTSWRASCFCKLWVLDLSYTDWYWLLSEEMLSVMADLRELNVKGIKHWIISDLQGSCRLLNLVKLLVTAEPTDEAQSAIAAAFPNLSSASSLKTVILDGCVGLQQVCPDALPASLESFSFSVDAATQGKGTKQISSVSFRGRARLKSLLLRGLFGSLEELDVSGTAVKTLDLRALQAPGLRRLLLSGCEKLRAILWPPGVDIYDLELLRIDTTSRSAPADGGEENLAAAAASAGLQAKKEEPFNTWRISLTDARLLRSLVPVKGYIRSESVHIDICGAATVGGSTVQLHTSTLIVDSKYRDVFKEATPANNNYVDVAAVPVTMMTWDCPEMPLPSSSDQRSCIIELITQGQGSSKLLEGAPQSASTSTSTSGLLLPDFVCDMATSLHVYDNSSITSVPAPPEGARWNPLRWCRVERCPKVHTVFATPQLRWSIFCLLSTFWASQLPTVRYIWNWASQLNGDSFKDLQFLHLDCCPRLIHVLPLPTLVATLRSLETLEIVCCGDLREVFPLDPERQEQGIEIEFPSLRHIYLHELPMLQRICGHKMSTPRLETVNIRGCWSLSRLPAVGDTEHPSTVDCEKEWWDGLQWDGPRQKHHPSLYRPSHSRNYKKTQLPKGSILR